VNTDRALRYLGRVPAPRALRVGRRPGWISWTLVPLFGLFLLGITAFLTRFLVLSLFSGMSMAGDGWWERALSLAAVVPLFGGTAWILGRWGLTLTFWPFLLGTTRIDGHRMVQREGLTRTAVDLRHARIGFRTGPRGEVLLVATEAAPDRRIELLVAARSRPTGMPGLPAIASALTEYRTDDLSRPALEYLATILHGELQDPASGIPQPCRMNVPPRDDDGDELFVRLLFGVLGWSFSLFGLLWLVTEIRFALDHVTTTAIGLDSSNTVEFTLPDGKPQEAVLVIAPRDLVGGQHLRIDYLDGDPSVARTAGSHGQLFIGVGALAMGSPMLWRAFRRKTFEDDPDNETPKRKVLKDST